VPIEVVIEETSETVVVRWTGTVTFGDFQRARSDVPAATGWSPHFAHVLDFTSVTALALSTNDIKSLAAAKPIFAPDALQILVARAGSVDYGISRMFEMYTEGKRRVHVVRSMEQAMALVEGARAATR